jgi:hypothetical protein
MGREEVGEMVDRGGIVGEDNDVIEIGKDDGRRGAGGL